MVPNRAATLPSQEENRRPEQKNGPGKTSTLPSQKESRWPEQKGKWRKPLLAPGCFDQPTFGLWAQHAASAPWCSIDESMSTIPKLCYLKSKQAFSCDFFCVSEVDVGATNSKIPPFCALLNCLPFCHLKVGTVLVAAVGCLLVAAVLQWGGGEVSLGMVSLLLLDGAPLGCFWSERGALTLACGLQWLLPCHTTLPCLRRTGWGLC